jgi:hypothetical protein
MSKLTDYSRFDHLDSDDDEPNEKQPPKQPETQAQVPTHRPPVAANPPPNTASPPPPPTTSLRKDESTGRYVFEYNGQEIYQWEQTLDDVTIHVKPPPMVTKGNQVNCQIATHHLKLGLHGATTFFLNEPTFGVVDVSESTWSLEDDDEGNTGGKVISIYLIKAHRGELWNAALKGNHTVSELDPVAQESVQKELMLERFQEEHPGFDFRDAEFNGGVPDPRTFMGGVKYQ